MSWHQQFQEYTRQNSLDKSETSLIVLLLVFMAPSSQFYQFREPKVQKAYKQIFID